MIVAAWVMLICFGVVSLKGLLRIISVGTMSNGAIMWWMSSTVLSALSAGVIWGWLFK